MIIGVKESTLMNKIFTFIKIAILTFVIICGATKVNIDNWKINTNVKSLCLNLINYLIIKL